MVDLRTGTDWGSELLPLLGRAAAVAVAAACLLLTVSVLGALLERSGTAPRLGTALLRSSPRPTRRLAVAVAAVALPFVGTAPAGALDTPVRTWLSGVSPASSPSTSVVTAPPATPATPPLAITDPVVREGDVERRMPTPPLASTTTLAAPTPTPAPVPTAPSPAPVVDASSALVTPSTYVVRAGDSLWSIAAHRLGTGASNRSIDRGWRVIYGANRDRVGPDPGLIHPGLVLTLPPLDAQP